MLTGNINGIIGRFHVADHYFIKVLNSVKNPCQVLACIVGVDNNGDFLIRHFLYTLD